MIFFIDEVYMIVGVGFVEGLMDVGNILKLVLVCGDL